MRGGPIRELPWLLLLAVAAVFGLVALLLSLWSPWSIKARRQPKVVLFGPCGSGKTSLLIKLLFGHFQPSHASVQENTGLLKSSLDTKPIITVDVPGHQRLRARLLAQHLQTASASVLVIDSLGLHSAKAIKETADHLQIWFALASLLPPSQTPILHVLLNKSDLIPSSATANATVDRAKAALGREMEKRRLLAASSSAPNQKIEGLEAASNAKAMPTDESEILQIDIFSQQSWQWDDLAVPATITWSLGSALKENGLAELEGWMFSLKDAL